MLIIDRYLLTEMLVPFGGGLLTFVVMITGHLLYTAVDKIVEHGVGMPSVAHFVVLQVPFAVVMSLPASALLACSLALNRLAAENELTAMRVGGAGLRRLLRPALVIGLGASLLGLVLSQWVVPWANLRSATLLQEFVAKRPALAFRPGKFTNTEAGLDFFAERVDPGAGRLGNLFVFQHLGNGPPLLTWSPEAHFTPRGLSLGPGLFYQLTPGGNLTYGSTGGTEVRLGALRFQPGPAARKVADLNLGELLTERARLEAVRPGAGRKYSAEMHWRISLAFASLVFALLALPVTLSFGRGQSLVGVLLTLVMVFLYYVIMLWLRMMADAGRLLPFFAAWLENGAILAVAALALWRQR